MSADSTARAKKAWGTSDQTIGPPWTYDCSHKAVCGTKLSTGGRITCFQMMFRHEDDHRLYWPLDEQADELGREMAELLNEVGTTMKDPNPPRKRGR